MDVTKIYTALKAVMNRGAATAEDDGGGKVNGFLL